MDEKLKYDTQLGEARLGFCVHIALFLAVNTLLVVVNLHFYSDDLWSLWPVLTWMFVLTAHAWRTRRIKKSRNNYDQFTKPELFRKQWG